MARTNVNFIVPSAWGKLYFLPIKNYDITYFVDFSAIKYQDGSRLHSQPEQKRPSCPQVWSVDIKKNNKWDSTTSVFLHRPQRCFSPGRRQRERRLSLKVQVCLSSKFFSVSARIIMSKFFRSVSLCEISWIYFLFWSNPLATKRRLNPTRPKELPSVRVVVAHPQVDFSAKPCLETWKDESRIWESCGVPFGWSLFAFSGIVPNPVERKAITM